MPRKGDNAKMAVIALVAERTATAEAEAARGTRFADSTTEPEIVDADVVEAAEADAEAAVVETEATDKVETDETEDESAKEDES